MGGGPNNFETNRYSIFDDADFVCTGDSGGPVFAQRPDGKLRLI